MTSVASVYNQGNWHQQRKVAFFNDCPILTQEPPTSGHVIKSFLQGSDVVSGPSFKFDIYIVCNQ